MKKIAWVLGAVFSACCGLSARATVTTNCINDVEVSITAAGDYFVYGTGTSTSNRIIANSPVTGINLTISNVQIQTTLASGPLYLANGSTMDLTLQGTNKLVFAVDGGTGIRLQANSSVTIDGDGYLYVGAPRNAYGTLVGAGIGIPNGGTAGSLTINSGTIYAYAGEVSAGIGGGYTFNGTGGHGGTVTINGGDVTAEGHGGGAGIGGGAAYYSTTGGIGGNGGSVTINGGRVHAFSRQGGTYGNGNNYGAAGIGGGASRNTGSCGRAGTLAISGGTVILDSERGFGFGPGFFNGETNNTIVTAGGGALTITGGTVMWSKIPLRADTPVTISGGAVISRYKELAAAEFPWIFAWTTNTLALTSATISNDVVVAFTNLVISGSANVVKGDLSLSGVSGSALDLTIADGLALTYAGSNTLNRLTCAGAAKFVPIFSARPFGCLALTAGLTRSNTAAALTVAPVSPSTTIAAGGPYTVVSGSGLALSNFTYDSSSVVTDTGDTSSLVWSSGDLQFYPGSRWWDVGLQGSLALTESKTYYVTGVSTNAATITVADGVSAALVMKDLHFQSLTNNPGISLGAGSSLSVTISNANTVAGLGDAEGIRLPASASLTFGGTNGTLAVLAGNGGYPGIGMESADSGSLTMNGGTVTVRAAADPAADFGAAGIGVRANATCGAVTVNGGSLTAYGAGLAAGIGGGYLLDGIGGHGGAVTVNGGSLAAYGYSGGAGIGGGAVYGYSDATTRPGNGGTVIVNGGTVTAVASKSGSHAGSQCGAGIGGGAVRSDGSATVNSSMGTLVVNGGTVFATSDGCAIGTGYKGVALASVDAAGSFVVSNGTVLATGALWDVGGGEGAATASTNVTAVIVGGSVTCAGKGFQRPPTNGAGLGGTALSAFVAPMSSYSSTATNTIAFTGSDGATVDYYKYFGTGTVGSVCFWLPADRLSVVAGSVRHIYTYPGVESGTYSVADYTLCVHGTNGNAVLTGTSSAHNVLFDPASRSSVTFSNLVVTASPAVSVVTGADVTVVLKAANTLTAKANTAPDLYLPNGSALTLDGTGSLTCNGTVGPGIGTYHNEVPGPGALTVNGGSLTASGGTGCAGIGLNSYETIGYREVTAGPVTINGGTVVAKGGYQAAGIGGGQGPTDVPAGNGGIVTINGGTVTATGNGGAGIGGGAGPYNGGTGTHGGNGGVVTINGGIVTATADNCYYSMAKGSGSPRGAGIGGGAPRDNRIPAGKMGTVKITGGTVIATGANGIGTGVSGTTILAASCPTNEDGTVEITGGTVTLNGAKWSIGGTELATSAKTNLQSVVVMGGSLKCPNGVQIATTNASGAAVFCVTSPVPYCGTSPYSVSLAVAKNAAYTYSYSGTGHTSDTNLYFWLPEGSYGLPRSGLVVHADGTYEFRAGFYLRVVDGGVTLPYDWISGKLPGVTVTDEAAVSNALVAAGSNGVPFWESYVLGLDPTNAGSRVLCDAEQDANTGTVTVNALNVNPPTGIAATIQYVLEGSADGSGWSAYSAALTQPTATITLSDAAPVYYRFRTDIIL